MAYDNPGSKTGGDGFFAMDDEPSGGDEKKDMSEKKDMAETSVLPKSMFGNHDPKVGEEYVFEVKRIFEDEVEIAYAPKKKGEDEGGDMEEGTMEHANKSMDDMAMEKSSY